MEGIDRKKALQKVEKHLFGKGGTISIPRLLERAAAILFIPLLLSALWFYYNSNTHNAIKKETVFTRMEVPLGMRSSMTLPDGTFVWLNAGSSLKYPVPFEGNERQVELTGEAYFEVKKDHSRPFVVSAGDVNIKVMGTSFNCCAYPGGKNIETALVEGKIEISDSLSGHKTIMNPGELATFSKSENKIEIKKTNLGKYVAWKSGKLMFRDDPMDKVLEKLGRWYNVEFQVENSEMLGYIYSATFTGESLDQMLKMFALSAPIEYQMLSKKKLNDDSYEKQVIKLTTKHIGGK